MDISGKIVVVTGAGSGIGEAVSLELAKRQAGTLVLVDRSDAVRTLATRIAEADGREVATGAFVGDVTDEGFRRHVFDEVIGGSGILAVPCRRRDHARAGLGEDQQGCRRSRTLCSRRLPTDIGGQSRRPRLLGLGDGGLDCGRSSCRQIGSLGTCRGTARYYIFIGSVSFQGNKGQIAYAATKKGLEGAAATVMKEAICTASVVA